ncbi:hypothetical protein F5Y04DRAFT_287580 [Hypomontagnella monticulosa]|nr:hypothetical protein F5Y04DRAFT_287580 [Hypomontagnella monticulosa]
MVNVSSYSFPTTGPVDQADGLPTQELSLYNGISNRSRGWKTRRSDKMEAMRTARKPNVARWDGAAMSSNAWDNLKRDPELWYRDGNCYIHLYGQGQSRRGPAFKVPFSRLLEANCYPFIDRFMARSLRTATGYTRDEHSDPARRSRIELFIPAPPRSNKQQSYKYHLATRNFIAYVFRRSMVGENLGSALISLMHSMYEFRTKDVDNVQDLMDYLDEEGYLNFKSNPTHAIAMLRLAETFQLRDLYIEAFAHCCGMSDQLPATSEYQHISPASRNLIHSTRAEMSLRLGRTSKLVGTFLQQELSEAHIGLYVGAQAHLERFRTLLHDFYSAKFGFYPPASIDSQTTIFEVDVLRTMRTDFEALFHYLVDEKFDITQNNPFMAQGGICVWQSIRSFDVRHEFKTIFHPLPLLPKTQEGTKRIAWLGKQMKSSQTRRENIHTALLEATNSRIELLKNGLVRVYRRFEDNLIFSPTKADKLENLGPMDGRKVRWILIYTIYQALRQVTEIPPEVRDSSNAPYHLCISTTELPPWDGQRPVHALVRRQTDHITHITQDLASDQDSTRKTSPHQHSFEIKPDIDYFAITHQESTTIETKDGTSRLRRAASWRGSLTRSFSRSLTTRRSSTKLTKQQPDRLTQAARNSPYHEIVVQGYGNGTSAIKASLIDAPLPATRSIIAEEEDPISDTSTPPSPSPSRCSSTPDSRHSEESSAAKTSDTSVPTSPSDAPVPLPWTKSHDAFPRLRTVASCAGLLRSSKDSSGGGGSSSATAGCGLIVRRKASAEPLLLRKADSSAPSHIEMPSPKAPTAWDHVKAGLEVKATSWTPDTRELDVQPEWEQYNDLGGLTELRPRGPLRWG